MQGIVTNWERPPPETSASALVERWLPAVFEASLASGRRSAEPPPLVRATLQGEGGGSWDVRASGANLDVAPAARSDPDLWLRQSAADFVAVFAGDPDLPDMIPPGWSALDLLFLDPRDAELLRRVDGRVLVEVAGRRRRRWAVDLAFGKAGARAGRPRATVRLDGATYTQLSRGSTPPLKPLVDGRLRVDGDRALVMQIMMLLGARLARR